MIHSSDPFPSNTFILIIHENVQVIIILSYKWLIVSSTYIPCKYASYIGLYEKVVLFSGCLLITHCFLHILFIFFASFLYIF